MSINTIVYVVESPLSDRDFDRFGLAVMLASGVQVEVWDVHEVYLPRGGLPTIETPTSVRIRSFHDEGTLTDACSGLSNETAVVLLSGVYLGNGPSHLAMLQALMRSSAVLGTVSAGHRAVETPDVSAAPKWLRRFWRQINLHGRGFRRAEARPSGYLKIARDRRTARRFLSGSASKVSGFRHLDWVWVATSVASIEPRLIGDRTRIRYIHTWDYDRLLLPEKAIVEAEVVFLDSMGPLHPEFVVLKMRSFISAEEWFAVIDAALFEIENRTGSTITIAAHPRALPGSLEPWYRNRVVIYGATVALIRSATLIVVATPTTSLGVAAVLRKPVTVLRPPNCYEGHLAELDAYSKLLSLQVVNYTDFSIGWTPPTVDNAAYDDFVERFVKREGTPETPFWQVVCRDLTEAD